MAQQINLFSPILLTPKRYFSARAMLQALALCALALAALCSWSLWRTQALQRELAASAAVQAAERAQLQQALAAQPGAGLDVQALEQELAAAERGLLERQRLLDDIGTGASAGHSPVALLRHLARTLPAPIWLTDLKLAGDRLELAGLTLQPEALQTWLAGWQYPPDAAGRAPALLQVQRRPDGGPHGGEAWSFRVVQGGPVPGDRP